jgi:hypothetical protein
LIFSATDISADFADFSLNIEGEDDDDDDEEQSVSEERKWEATTASGTLGPRILRHKSCRLCVDEAAAGVKAPLDNDEDDDLSPVAECSRESIVSGLLPLSPVLDPDLEVEGDFPCRL